MPICTSCCTLLSTTWSIIKFPCFSYFTCNLFHLPRDISQNSLINKNFNFVSFGKIFTK